MIHNPKILITYVLTGAGHLAPARAVAKYLWEHYPDNPDIKLCDFFKETNNHRIDDYLITFLDKMVKYPRRNIFVHNNILKRSPLIAHIWMYVKFRSSFNNAYEYLQQERPDIIVSNHAFTAYVIQKVRKRLDFDFKLISFNTDPHTSNIFLEVNRGNDAVIISSQETRTLLAQASYPEEKIILLPFPLDKRFDQNELKNPLMLEDMQLDPRKKTLLISFGGGGYGNATKLIRNLKRKGVELNILIITGKNEIQYHELRRMYPETKQGSLHIKVFGFVDNMVELLGLCDLTFIKPGASSTYEALIMKKPIIFSQYTSHIEKANADFVTRSGVGFYAGKDVNKFITYVQYLLDDEHLQQVMQIYEQLDIVNGTAEIAEFVYHIRDDEFVEEEAISN